MFFQNRFVNDLIQGKLCRYHLLIDYSPEQATRGPVESWAQQYTQSSIQWVSCFMSIKPSRSVIKSHWASLNILLTFVKVISLSSPSPSLIHFLSLPPSYASRSSQSAKLGSLCYMGGFLKWCWCFIASLRRTENLRRSMELGGLVQSHSATCCIWDLAN